MPTADDTDRGGFVTPGHGMQKTLWISPSRSHSTPSSSVCTGHTAPRPVASAKCEADARREAETLAALGHGAHPCIRTARATRRKSVKLVPDATSRPRAGSSPPMGHPHGAPGGITPPMACDGCLRDPSHHDHAGVQLYHGSRGLVADHAHVARQEHRTLRQRRFTTGVGCRGTSFK